jgi:hypothetical protein
MGFELREDLREKKLSRVCYVKSVQILLTVQSLNSLRFLRKFLTR